MRGHAVDARVDAERQAVTRGVDRVDERVEFAPLPRRDVQHRAEYLALQIGDMIEADQGRRHEMTVRGQVGPLRLGANTPPAPRFGTRGGPLPPPSRTAVRAA